MARVLLFVALLGVCMYMAAGQKLYKLNSLKRHSALPRPDDCEPCNPDNCRVPTGCVAGFVRDRCGCCNVCGKGEFELCDHPQVQGPRDGQGFGKCGENLKCTLRKDLPPNDPLEATCSCTIEGNLCGSDEQTYENICQLMAAGVSMRRKITVNYKGPCKTAPKIVTPPEHAKNETGGFVALGCEATGFPIPTIMWTWTRVDGKTEDLPNDDNHISINTRGGPESWQATSWLQIFDLKKEHEGDYICIAANELAEDSSKGARVKIVEKYGSKDDRKYKYEGRDQYKANNL